MCGIVGIRRLDGGKVDEAVLRCMTEQLDHRGPDERAVWVDGSVGFGHTRLSIIDVQRSHQPMASACGRVHLCFNGEIFNYQDLRRSLVSEGASFRTHGDTEAILVQYLLRGVDGIQEFDGQFSFAIHDARDDLLFLFRDRLGILPLYYYHDGTLFAFASEIKALLPAIPRRIEVDVDSVRDYLAYRSVPPPNTLFRGVHKLPAGHRLRLCRDGRATVEEWWRLPTDPVKGRMSPRQATELVGRALEGAVRSRLVSDVPVGAYLSGGLDSSLIVALMRKIRRDDGLETYSAGFGDPRYDELPYALEVADLLQTNHHPVNVRSADFEALWPRLTWHRDAPLSEPADVAVYKLACEARGTVKVLLSGEGGDELFAGYPKYRFARLAAISSFFPPSLRGGLFRTAERLLPRSMSRVRIMLRAMTAGSEADRFQTWFAPFTRYERQRLLPGEERDTHRLVWSRATGDLIQRMLYVDCHTWLADNLLERGDRMSMAASIESRPPFLDHRLVEIAFQLPSNRKVLRGVTKWVLKNVARTYLPDSIVDRKKVGFRVPLDVWFKGKLGDMAQDLLLSTGSFVADLFARPAIERLLAGHRAGRRNEDIRIWTLLGLEIWHTTFFSHAGIQAARSRLKRPAG